MIRVTTPEAAIAIAEQNAPGSRYDVILRAVAARLEELKDAFASEGVEYDPEEHGAVKVMDHPDDFDKEEEGGAAPVSQRIFESITWHPDPIGVGGYWQLIQLGDGDASETYIVPKGHLYADDEKWLEEQVPSVELALTNGGPLVDKLCDKFRDSSFETFSQGFAEEYNHLAEYNRDMELPRDEASYMALATPIYESLKKELYPNLEADTDGD
jgi:hypothetical protein